MGVPAHDKRDFEFCKVNNIVEKVRFVVEPTIQELDVAFDYNTPFTALGVLNEASGPYKGLKSKAAKKAVLKDAVKMGIGRSATQVKEKQIILAALL